MRHIVGIGGLFFRARSPEALSKWYAEKLGVTGDEGFWGQDAGPTVFSPFPANTDYFGREDQHWMVNFRVQDLDGLLANLRQDGIEIETRAEWDSEIGRFARIHDPEGNPIELWEPGPSCKG